jgi:DNA polymerase III subunit delta
MNMSAATFKQKLFSSQLEQLYFLSGDEPIQLMTCLDSIRSKAKEEGIVERLVFDVSGMSDWGLLESEINAMSLFSDKRLIEVQMGSKKPDKSSLAILTQISLKNNPDDHFVVVLENGESSLKKNKWFKSLQSNGIFFESKNLDNNALSAWVVATSKEFKKTFSDNALQLFCERVEGNLLVASQELEKLALTVSNERILESDIANSMGDSGRFDIYQLTDTLLRRDLKRSLRIIRGLKEIGVEPILIIWAVVRELRLLATIIGRVENGESVAKLIDSYRIWGVRKGAFEVFLKQVTSAQVLKLLSYANYIDTVIKGARQGNIWDEIEILSFNICDMMAFSKLMAKD